MSRWLVLAVLLGASACSNRAVYDNISIHQRNECLDEPPPLYESCMEQANKPFGQYQRERREALEAESSPVNP